MISKERLLSGLHEMVYVEEGMVTTLASFAKAVTSHTESLDAGKKKDIDKMLSRLYNDSSKHKEMVEEIIRKVESGDKNEY